MEAADEELRAGWWESRIAGGERGNVFALPWFVDAAKAEEEVKGEIVF